MNKKLTALSLCFLVLLADVLCLAKMFEVARLSEIKIKLFAISEIFLAIAMLYFIAVLATKIAANRAVLYRRFLPVSFLKLDRSKFESGFLKRQTS